MRNRFDRQLERLNIELTEMGALIEEAIAVAIKALVADEGDSALCSAEIEDAVNAKESEIEQLCFKLLLHQQPVASDLRLISAALKMITDMERIGDQAVDITELAEIIRADCDGKNLDLIPKMAEETVRMVTDSIDAFVRRDITLAVSVCESDDMVDSYFCRIKSDITELISKDKSAGEQALDMLMIAKYFERIGDHAVNIAEWVIYSITGEHGKVKKLDI